VAVDASDRTVELAMIQAGGRSGGEAAAQAAKPEPAPQGRSERDPSPRPRSRQESNRKVVEQAGVFGAYAESGLEQVVGARLPAGIDQVGTLIGATQVFGGVWGGRGNGFGAGGEAEGIGGLSLHGPGTGGSCDWGDCRGGGLRGGGHRDGAIGVGTDSDAIVLGSLDRAEIDEVIKRNMNQIRYCYQRVLQTQPELSGKLTVKFTIATDGTVSSASSKASTLGAPAVESCIVDRFRRMKFPAPKGGGIVLVSYPFLFDS
jgi:TonB family protein